MLLGNCMVLAFQLCSVWPEQCLRLFPPPPISEARPYSVLYLMMPCELQGFPLLLVGSNSVPSLVWALGTVFISLQFCRPQFCMVGMGSLLRVSQGWDKMSAGLKSCVKAQGINPLLSSFLLLATFGSLELQGRGDRFLAGCRLGVTLCSYLLPASLRQQWCIISISCFKKIFFKINTFIFGHTEQLVGS